MARGNNRFKTTDVVRAVKAATAAGLTVGSITVNTKTHEITVLAKGDAPQLGNGGDERNPWDEAYGMETTEVRERNSKNQK